MNSGKQQSTRWWWATTVVGNLLIGALFIIPVFMLVVMSGFHWLGPTTGVYGDNDGRGTVTWLLLALWVALVAVIALAAWLLNVFFASRLRSPRQPPPWLLSVMLIPLPTVTLFGLGQIADW